MTGALPVVALLSSLALVEQQPPQRDATITPTTGTATVSGVVVSDHDRPQPVRRAIVTLSGSGLVPSRGAVTDDEGRFVIANLPAGRFTLIASRASYVTSAFGAKRPGRPGTPIVVGDGAQVGGLIVKLWRGAVVSGVVREGTGAPQPGVLVRAISAKPAGAGALASLTNNGVRTDDAGEFRIFGLEPGAYVVAAEPASGGSQMIGLREAEVDAILDALKRRGSTATTSPPAMPASRPFDYAPIYYPSAVSLAQASPLNLSAGQEVLGLGITLQQVSRSSVTGFVLRPDGTPAAGAAVQLTAIVPPGPFAASSVQPLNATAGPDGSFRVPQVAPGEYQLIARASAGPPPPARQGIATPGPSGPQLWVSTNVTVTGGDIGGLSLTVEPGFTFTGRVVFQSEALKPPPNPALRVSVLPASVLALKPGTPIDTIAFVPGVSVGADGTFEIRNVPPGMFRLIVSGTAGPWTVQSAVTGDRDLMDGDFPVRGGGEASVTVVLSDRSTELSGVLQSAAGAPASDVFVIAYSSNRTFWGPGTRRVQAVRPGVDGRYSMRNLPPGEYFLAAVLDIDQDDWNGAGFLDQLIPASVKITIADGEKKTQDLRIGR